MVLLPATVFLVVSSLLLFSARSVLGRTVPYFSHVDDLPPSGLDNVYWWSKHFNQMDDLPPYFDEDETDGGVKKRDYTAGQLVNMLKALAKARRQRNIRVAGKGLRFGISR